MNTIHTAAALADMPDRDLDALAHEAVFGDKPIAGPMFSMALVNGFRQLLPGYSTSLDEVALLEAELIKRGLGDQYDHAMCDLPDKQGLPMVGAGRLAWLLADAKTRTVAAVMAMQNITRPIGRTGEHDTDTN